MFSVRQQNISSKSRPNFVRSIARQSGMTLIEIMIALLIGAFLLGGVLEIFVSTKQTNRMEENLSRLQEDGRHAMDFLIRDLRLADYQCDVNGTRSLTAVGGDITASNPIPTDDDNGLNGSDKITVTSVTIDGGIFGQPTWNDGVSDDELPKLTNDPARSNVNGVGSCTRAAKKALTYDIQLGAWGGPSLWRREEATALILPQVVSVQELIQGVQDMQIVYGVDTDNDGSVNYFDSYRWILANDRANIISLRVSLLMMTLDDNLTSAPQTYFYNGQTITAPDNRIRRVFTSTIAIRNRVRQ